MINTKYSYKDFQNIDLSMIDASDFNNSEIIGACFFQENKRQVFPDGIENVTFKNCNLNNVDMSNAGGYIIYNDSANDHLTFENDGEWWKRSNGNLNEPLNKQQFIDNGFSILPKDIPSEAIGDSIIRKKKNDDYLTKKAQANAIMRGE
jgi:hypothetical protein